MCRAARGRGARIALAEALGADVVTDLKVAAAFPTDHPLHPGNPMLVFADDRSLSLIREADVILSLDWVDMVNLFRRVWPDGSVPPKVIQISADRLVHNGWSRDHMGLPVADIDLLAEPCLTVPMLLEEIRRRGDAALAKPRPPVSSSAATRRESCIPTLAGRRG